MTLGGEYGFAAAVNMHCMRIAADQAMRVEQAAAVACRLFGGPGHVHRLDWRECGHSAFIDSGHPLEGHPHHCPHCDGRRHTGCDVHYVTIG